MMQTSSGFTLQVVVPLGSALRACAQGIAARWRLRQEAARQSRRERDILRSLRRLDARTLRDLGLERCEPRSAAVDHAMPWRCG